MNLIDTGLTNQRIDKWLWHARIVRTRTRATALVNSGKVRLNQRRITRASHTIHLGNIILAPQGNHIRCLKVTGFAKRRVPAAQTEDLYEDLAPIITERKAAPQKQPIPPSGSREAGSGRPTKRDRRLIEQLHNKI